MQQPTTTHNIKQYSQQCLDHSHLVKGIEVLTDVVTQRSNCGWTRVSSSPDTCYSIASTSEAHWCEHYILSTTGNMQDSKQHRSCVNQIYISLPPESLWGQAEGQATLVDEAHKTEKSGFMHRASCSIAAYLCLTAALDLLQFQETFLEKFSLIIAICYSAHMSTAHPFLSKLLLPATKLGLQPLAAACCNKSLINK